ncbi:MAG: PadR family transcriptional regulator [Eubacterium sp.]|nr:PadR family transcriptional regulator [Eubacterium sp.]
MTYQLTAPLLDACVLGIVDKEDSYGYTLTQKVRELVDISESTLYPVLRRLQKEQCLTTYDQPFQGRNRRYYKITEEGRHRLRFYQSEWEEYKNKVDVLIGGKEVNGIE